MHSATIVSGVILTPVRLGTLCRRIGRSTAFATSEEMNFKPFWVDFIVIWGYEQSPSAPAFFASVDRYTAVCVQLEPVPATTGILLFIDLAYETDHLDVLLMA